MTPDYKELRALEAEALEGPWDDVLVNVEVDGHTYCGGYGDANCKFVRAARNALPEILDELEKMQKRIAYLERESEKLYALEAAGVDNWEGYGDALSELRKGDEE